MTDSSIKALVFDVFGTVVDWRTSVAREVEDVAVAKGWAAKGSAARGSAARGSKVDPTEFAVAWRAKYHPSMEPVRRGEKPYTRLDDLHRESLKAVLAERGLADSLDADELEHLNRAWHRLTPWRDSVPGLTRLKTKFILATMSNGNTALMVNMAKHSGLPWDTILGSEPAQNYKPMATVYLTGADWLGLRPDEVMMTAAHNNDLSAARALGFRTAFIRRPNEHGPHQTTDLQAAEDWTYVADSMEDLADQLGC
jgi:2-haloacid dehalogenase